MNDTTTSGEFTHLAQRLGDIKPPPVLPDGVYSGTIHGYELTRHRSFASRVEPGEKEAIVSWRIELHEPQSEEARELTDAGAIRVEGKTLFWQKSIEGTPEAQWALRNALIGLLGENAANMTVSESLANTSELPVLVTIRTRVDKNDVSRKFNDIAAVVAR
jgi:hypothetical protein